MTNARALIQLVRSFSKNKKRSSRSGKINILSVLLVTVMLTGCIKDNEDPVWSLQAGDSLPDFEVSLNDGSSVTTNMLKGHSSVVVFFSTNCGDCRKELPAIQDYYESCKMRDPSCFFVCISRDEGEASVSAYWKENGFTMPYSAQTDRSVYNLFANSGIPRIYEADPDLVITRVFE